MHIEQFECDGCGCREDADKADSWIIIDGIGGVSQPSIYRGGKNRSYERKVLKDKHFCGIKCFEKWLDQKSAEKPKQKK